MQLNLLRVFKFTFKTKNAIVVIIGDLQRCHSHLLLHIFPKILFWVLFISSSLWKPH